MTSLQRTLRRAPSEGAVAEAVNHVTWITQNGCSGHGSLKCIINIFQPFSGVLASLPNDGMSLEMASMLVGKRKLTLIRGKNSGGYFMNKKCKFRFFFFLLNLRNWLWRLSLFQKSSDFTFVEKNYIFLKHNFYTYFYYYYYCFSSEERKCELLKYLQHIVRY